jgi:hypothetical protein
MIPLLRDILGNPFCRLTTKPAWLTPTVVALAQGIYADRAFDRLIGCAWCRTIWDLMPDTESQSAVEAAERWADGELSVYELSAVREQVERLERSCPDVVYDAIIPLCLNFGTTSLIAMEYPLIRKAAEGFPEFDSVDGTPSMRQTSPMYAPQTRHSRSMFAGVFPLGIEYGMSSTSRSMAAMLSSEKSSTSQKYVSVSWAASAAAAAIRSASDFAAMGRILSPETSAIERTSSPGCPNL